MKKIGIFNLLYNSRLFCQEGNIKQVKLNKQIYPFAYVFARHAIITCIDDTVEILFN